MVFNYSIFKQLLRTQRIRKGCNEIRYRIKNLSVCIERKTKTNPEL
ncbi:hypothetical protein GGU45_004330 [Niabella hirudinis]